jgi:ATP-binding cassette subfamily B (MDR/TAP) protein 1
MTIATLIAGFVFAFITGWLMTLVVLATIPALGIAGYFYMKVIGDKDKNEQKSYSKAGGRAEQAISSIKTIKQLNGEQFEYVQYQKCLEEASKNSFKYSVYAGMGIASIFFVMLASYSLGFWYGSKCILSTKDCPYSVSNQHYTAGDVLVVFFSVVMAGFNLSQLTPAFEKIAKGRQAASRIFAIIDREPLIKNPENGIKI